MSDAVQVVRGGPVSDPQTVHAAAVVLATIDNRHGLLEDQDRRLREGAAALETQRREGLALAETMAADRLEHEALTREIVELREELRTAKARLQQETLIAREGLRDAAGRLENIRQQTNNTESELFEARKRLAGVKSEYAQAQ